MQAPFLAVRINNRSENTPTTETKRDEEGEKERERDHPKIQDRFRLNYTLHLVYKAPIEKEVGKKGWQKRKREREEEDRGAGIDGIFSKAV